MHQYAETLQHWNTPLCSFLYLSTHLVQSFPSLPQSLPLLEIKLCCQLQEWNKPLFIFLVLHKHRHMLIWVAVLTHLPIWESCIDYLVRECGGLIGVGVEVIKLWFSLVDWIHNRLWLRKCNKIRLNTITPTTPSIHIQYTWNYILWPNEHTLMWNVIKILWNHVKKSKLNKTKPWKD